MTTQPSSPAGVVIARANQRVSAALLDALVAAGLRHVIVCPGSRSTPLVLAVQQRPELEPYVVLDERAAGFLALGIARYTGHAAAVICTSGSAATHLYPAVVEASASRVPMVVLSADRPRELQRCGAPQTLDQTRLFGTHVRWFAELDAPRDVQASTRHVRTMAAQAWLYGHGPDAGPVHLNLPYDEPLWLPELEQQGESEPELPTAVALVRGVPVLDNEAASVLVRRLLETERGVMVCGPLDPGSLGGIEGGAAGAVAAIAELAEALGWPLIAEPGSQLRVGEARCSGLIAHAELLLNSAAMADQLEPTLVLRFGAMPTAKNVASWLARCAVGRVVLFDPAGRVHDAAHTADTLVIADLEQCCRMLARQVRSARASISATWVERWLAAEQMAAGVAEQAVADGLWEGAIAHEVLHALPDRSLLHVAGSMPVRDLDSVGGVRRGQLTVTANRGVNGIDGTLATAGGMALACAGQRCVTVVLGDLAFLHDLDGLASIAQLGVSLCAVVINNGGGGIFEHLPISRHPTAFEPFFLTPQRARIADLCTAVGARWTQVESREALSLALQEAFGQPGLVVIEVAVDRRENVLRQRQMRAAVARALGVEQR